MNDNIISRIGLNKLNERINAWLKARQIKFPIRSKITLPYLFLAVLLAISATFLVTNIVFDTVEERYRNQLAEVAQLSSELMVVEENKQLETLRFLANPRRSSWLSITFLTKSRSLYCELYPPVVKV